MASQKSSPASKKPAAKAAAKPAAAKPAAAKPAAKAATKPAAAKPAAAKPAAKPAAKAAASADCAHSTNYHDTFLTIAPDCAATQGTVPPLDKPTVASLTYRMIAENPYRYTSDDILFTVYADRNALPAGERDAARRAFFAKPQACLRASDLGKKYGWGIHADEHGRVALVGCETKAYRELAEGKRRGANGEPVRVKPAMRSSRA